MIAQFCALIAFSVHHPTPFVEATFAIDPGDDITRPYELQLSRSHRPAADIGQGPTQSKYLPELESSMPKQGGQSRGRRFDSVQDHIEFPESDPAKPLRGGFFIVR